MDEATYNALTRIMKVIATIHNSDALAGIEYEDLQRVVVWIDNERNLKKRP
jgi:hypothetical protein